MTKLYRARDHVLICTDYADPAPHRHMAAHIILSLGGPMNVTLPDRTVRCQGILIPSGIAHGIDTNGTSCLVFLYGCTSSVAAQISSVRCLSDKDCIHILWNFRAWNHNSSPVGYGHFQENLLARLGLISSPSPLLDGRICSAIQNIRANFAEPMTCRDAARQIFLSESRFSHLFRQQTGMTFRSYLTGQRLLGTYAGILHGLSITEAALAAGFSSSSHFADVNRRVFGISARTVTQNIECFQVT